MNLAVSTTAFRKQPVEVIIQKAVKENLQIEFSSGIPHRPDMEELFIQAPCKKLLHNYCPAPKEPFVLNLASLDPTTFQRSLTHCQNCLKLVAQTQGKFYSVHAGFCLDPSPSELGKKLSLTMQNPREEHWTQFLKAVDTLVADAKKLGIKLLIENNVLAPFNMLPDGTHPLLAADPAEMELLLNQFPTDHLGLLIDTGHLKVSAQTLDFRPDLVFEKLGHRIFAFHHSDNNGSEDSNHPIVEDYWFLNYLDQFRSATHVLEVHDQDISAIRKQFQLLEGNLKAKRIK